MRKTKVQKDEARRLLKKGVVPRVVAMHFGCSRQYICAAFPAEIEKGRITREKKLEKMMVKK